MRTATLATDRGARRLALVREGRVPTAPAPHPWRRAAGAVAVLMTLGTLVAGAAAWSVLTAPSAPPSAPGAAAGVATR